MRSSSLWLAFWVVLCAAACGHSDGESATPTSGNASATAGEVVTPPFAVSGDLSGLMLVWFDDQGPHIASKRDDIPAAHRDKVRVDSLSVAPEQRLDPNFVYLADVRSPGPNGSYVVHKVARERFDAMLDEAAHVVMAENGAAPNAANPNAGVIIYGASWCGACHQAAAFFRANHVEFVEKDIEREPAARTEMQTKCEAAGLHPTGIPVIDFRGHLVLGFDEGQLRQFMTQAPSIQVSPAVPNAPPAAPPPGVQVI